MKLWFYPKSLLPQHTCGVPSTSPRLPALALNAGPAPGQNICPGRDASSARARVPPAELKQTAGQGREGLGAAGCEGPRLTLPRSGFTIIPAMALRRPIRRKMAGGWEGSKPAMDPRRAQPRRRPGWSINRVGAEGSGGEGRRAFPSLLPESGLHQRDLPTKPGEKDHQRPLATVGRSREGTLVGTWGSELKRPWKPCSKGMRA